MFLKRGERVLAVLPVVGNKWIVSFGDRGPWAMRAELVFVLQLRQGPFKHCERDSDREQFGTRRMISTVHASAGERSEDDMCGPIFGDECAGFYGVVEAETAEQACELAARDKAAREKASA